MKYLPKSNEIFSELSAVENERKKEMPTVEQ